MTPPYRVYATFIKRGATRPVQPQWFYFDRVKFRSFGLFSGSISAENLIIVEHDRNDPEAVEIITKAKENNSDKV